MMKTPRRWILILSLLATGAQAQSGIPVRIAEVSDTPQVVRVNEVLPERFVAQGLAHGQWRPRGRRRGDTGNQLHHVPADAAQLRGAAT